MRSRRLVHCAGACLLLLLVIPAVHYSVSYSTSVEMYEGDVIETRDCRMCGGSGADDDMPELEPGAGRRCTFCRGRGRVRVLVPGPNRPTRLWGAIVDREIIGEPSFYYPGRVRALPFEGALGEGGRGPGSDLLGAIPGATVRFIARGGATTTVRANETGRFSQRLAPGIYEVEIEAPGFKEYRPVRTLEIAPLEGPVWLEHATLVQPIGGELEGGFGLDPEEARATYGLIFLGGLSEKQARRGFFRAYPATADS